MSDLQICRRLHLYVMLSRATPLDNLLLLRAPEVGFLLRGPPKELRTKLAVFAERVEHCVYAVSDLHICRRAT